MKHELNESAFRTMFPQFGDADVYTSEALVSWWDMATCAMNPNDNCVINGKCLQTALNLMTAHIATLMTRIACGQTGAPGAVSAASIDKVSVTFTVPPFKTGWQAWLSSTPYGLQLWAMLQMQAAGGFYVGGAPEAAAFRKVGGSFRG